MDLKLVLLRQLGWLICEVEEIDGVELGDPNCKLIKPRTLKLEPIVDTEDTVFAVRAEDIITMANPGKELMLKYIEGTK